MLSERPVTFHLSVNVVDLDRSVAFFKKVFGIEPAKHREDYAKFELTNPPMTFSLEPQAAAEGGKLNHAGFKFESAEELVALQRRLERAGIRSEREAGVECCYSKQTKFWLHDPDATLWEMYIMEGDIDHRGEGQSEDAVNPNRSLPTVDTADPDSDSVAESPRVWSHRLGRPRMIPDSLGAGALDEVHLQGTLNGPQVGEPMSGFLLQLRKRLKPGGRLTVHGLTTDRPLREPPVLPGPAAVVKDVPVLEALFAALAAAGFESLRLTKYGSKACFTVGDAELRETIVEAFTPDVSAESVLVVYGGPAAELQLDGGKKLYRGRPESVPGKWAAAWTAGPLGDSITILEKAKSRVACTGE